MDVGKQVSLIFCFQFFGIYAQKVVVLFVNFHGPAILFSIVAVPFYTTTSNVQEFQYLYILVTTVFLCLFIYLAILAGARRLSHCGFNCSFLMIGNRTSFKSEDPPPSSDPQTCVLLVVSASFPFNSSCS
jgi:hypothetical protein